MDREKTKYELECLKKIRAHYIETFTEAIDEDIKQLESQLASEPPKPLGHGEIVKTTSSIDNQERYYIAFDKPNDDENRVQIWGRNEDGSGYINGTVKKDNTHYKLVGINIFDDLSAMAEDVEEFEKKARKCNGKISIKLKAVDENGITQPFGTTKKTIVWFETDSGYFELDETQEIHRKLGALIATALRKAKGESNE